jgi:tRNA dimethylallyltransferase
MDVPRPILIAGPTASGKSALALALAERLGGTVINADSMQVYRELRILTARPTVEDEARAPHALYGFVSGAEAYSAGRYAADAARAIAEAQAAGRVPIVVGGTGLYFRALLEGLSPIPAADPEVRAFWRAEAARRPAAELHALLEQRDSEMAARLMPTDPQRIVRALEVLESTGRSLAAWQREPGRPVLAEAETIRLLLLPEREGHGALMEARFDAMLEMGALDEVRGLVAAGFSTELPIMRALGVAQLAAHLGGAVSLEDAASAAKHETRKYAKRQLTWLRRNMIAWREMKQQEVARFMAHEVPFIFQQGLTPAAPTDIETHSDTQGAKPRAQGREARER